MKHIGLFEGIGGFSLAARWMGWETVAWCEWDAFCQKILKYHFPEAEQHGDITTTDFTRYAGQINILTGGFPCQPYSSAGKRLGKEDDRHLWPEMLRAIREIQPRWVVGENVRGLTNWNGGLVFDEVQADLENEGYEVTPYLLPACAVNAPHRRDRIWFIAHAISKGAGCERGQTCDKEWGSGEDRRKGIRQENRKACASGNNTTGSDGATSNTRQAEYEGRNQYAEGQQPKGGRAARREPSPSCRTFYAADTNEKRLERQAENGYMGGQQRPLQCVSGRRWEDFPTQPPVCGRDDGLSAKLDGITFPKWREKSIGAYGNAIVPQVAYQIFQAINQYEQ